MGPEADLLVRPSPFFFFFPVVHQTILPII